MPVYRQRKQPTVFSAHVLPLQQKDARVVSRSLAGQHFECREELALPRLPPLLKLQVLPVHGPDADMLQVQHTNSLRLPTAELPSLASAALHSDSGPRERTT